MEFISVFTQPRITFTLAVYLLTWKPALCTSLNHYLSVSVQLLSPCGIESWVELKKISSNLLHACAVTGPRDCTPAMALADQGRLHGGVIYTFGLMSALVTLQFWAQGLTFSFYTKRHKLYDWLYKRKCLWRSTGLEVRRPLFCH